MICDHMNVIILPVIPCGGWVIVRHRAYYQTHKHVQTQNHKTTFEMNGRAGVDIRS